MNIECYNLLANDIKKGGDNMRSREEQAQLGARIPVDLKEVLSKYCINNGIKLNHFVTEAIREKLLEGIEDYEDLIEAKKRLKDAKYVPLEELEKYLRKRGAKI
jgi:predicted DNA-binding protein